MQITLVKSGDTWILPENKIESDNNDKEEIKDVIKSQTGLSPKIEEKIDESKNKIRDPKLGTVEIEAKYFLAKSETVKIPMTPKDGLEVKWFTLKDLDQNKNNIDKHAMQLIAKAVKVIKEKA
jgi:hypothetical protein